MLCLFLSENITRYLGEFGVAAAQDRGEMENLYQKKFH